MDDTFLALFVALFAVVVLVPFIAVSGFVGFNFFHPEELYLHDYDVAVQGNEPVCVSYVPFGNATFSVNNVPKNASLEGGNACVPVPEGTSRVTIEQRGRTLSFIAEKRAFSPAGNTSLRIAVPPRAREYEQVPIALVLSLGGTKAQVRHIEVLVDGERARDIPVRMFPGETAELNETIRLGAGRHEITAALATGERAAGIVHVEKRFSSPLLFPLLFLPWLFLFRKRLHLVALGAAGFVLLAAATLMVADFTALAAVFGALTLAAFFTAKEKFPKKMELRGLSSESKQALLLFGMFILLTAVPKLFFSDYTPWNVYYERQADAVFYEGNVQPFDGLSYQGRYLSFPHGYFAAKAAFMWFLGLEPGEFSTTLFGLLSNGLLILSLVYFASGRGLRAEARIIFSLAFMMALFTFTLVSANLMHVLSLALLVFALSLFTERSLFFSGIVLGAAAIVHPFTLVAFALCALAMCLESLETRQRIFPILLPLGGALALFGILYAPTLLALGAPTEQAPREWGYLLHWGFPSLITEFALAVPIFLFAAWKGGRLGAYFVLLLLAYSFLSFRLNIAVAFAGALLAARAVHQEPKLFAVMFAALLLNAVPFLFIATGYARPCDDIYLTNECTEAMEYLSLYPRNTTVLAPLIYGHTITGLAGLKVVADPYVEYADAHRLQDVMQFERTGNDAIAPKWNASLVIAAKSCSGDVVYDNRYVNICRLPEA